MRPTDENQSSPRRPTLMSPLRRSSGEIHILAMLDGRAAIRRKPARPALRWYCAGALLACTLLGVLTWIAGGTPARDAGTTGMAAAQPAPAAQSAQPAPTPRAQTNVADADAGTAADAGRLQSANAAPDARAAARPDTTPAVRGAIIVDVAPPAPATAARAAAAPPGPVAAIAPADAVSGGPAVASGPRAFAHVAPPRAAAPARPQPPHRVVPHQAPSQPASQPGARAPSLARVDTSQARHKRGPAMVRAPSTQSATIDTDVAVITAILQHAGAGTSGDGADAVSAAPCLDRPCGPRMPSR